MGAGERVKSNEGMLKRRTFLVAACLCAMLQSGHSSAYAADRPLTVALPAFPAGLGNPFTSGGFPGIDFYGAMFDGLAELAEDGSLKPALARSWHARDERTWEFVLRPNVKFANGENFDAGTVVEVFALLSTAEAQRWSMIREVRNIESVVADGALKVVVKTREPDLLLPARFAAIKMVPPKYFREVGAQAFARAPIGTGGFMVERWEGQKITLVENPYAWRKPKQRRLEILAVPEAAARRTGVQTGAIDVALNMGPEDIPLIESGGGSMAVYPQSGLTGLSFVLVKPSVLSDVRVRQALNYAVNKQAIVDVIFAGRTKAASQAAPSTAFGFDAALKPYPYDPAKAKTLLAEAGFEKGFAITADITIAGSTDASLWQQVAADLAAVGVTLKLNVMTFARASEAMYQGNWSGEAFAMNYGTLPALDPLVGFQYHSCLWIKPWVCDQAQTDLIRRGMREFDRAKREAFVKELMRVTHDDPLGIYLYEIVRFDALSARVAAYRSPFGHTAYHNIELKD
jgi:peptide/nickel transport system substrate-binding protein